MLWMLFLLLSNVELSFSTIAETISTHIHVAANDHMVVFARNRDSEFHITLSPYETPTVVLHLNYDSVQTEAVQSLVIPTKTSGRGLLEIVFIGQRRNSSEKVLFHAQLQQEEKTQQLSVVHLVQTSLAMLSSVGVECVLGINPQATQVFVIGDRAGYVYNMKESLIYNWSSWRDEQSKIYPKAIGVTMDDHVIVGAYLQLVDTIVPALYIAKLYSTDTVHQLELFAERKEVEITNLKAPMSITLRGSAEEDDFAMAIGLPSIDSVLLYLPKKGPAENIIEHRSAERGVNFGQAVTFTANNSYGVLASELATPPWSKGRVQVRCVLRVVRRKPAELCLLMDQNLQ